MTLATDRRQAPPKARTIAEASARHALARPDAIAVECAGRTVAFADLHARSNRTAHALARDGIVPGTRVAHLAPDSEHFYDLLIACAKVGAVLVPVDPRLTRGEVEHVLRDSGAAALFAQSDRLAALDGVHTTPEHLRTVVTLDASAGDGGGFAAWKADAPDDEPAAVGPGNRALMQMYTSGTTGSPKGVVLSAGSFWAVNDLLGRHRLDWLDWHEEDRSLGLLPAHHIGGPWWFLQGFRAGAANILTPGFDARSAMELIRGGGITEVLLVPSMLQILLDEPGARPGAFPDLRKLVYGGSPIPEALLERGLAVFGCEFAQIYGLTETCASAVCLPPADHVPGSPRLRAAGRPYPGVAVQVVDESGNALPPGRVGEVLLDTPAVMDGYWQRPEETRGTMTGGWLRTGDAGHLDEDGYLYIDDRIKDVVLVAGENVYPAEVERALARHPAVADVAVVSSPDPVLGERVCAVVVPEGGCEVALPELVEWLTARRMARQKLPERLILLDDLPRNAGGKILRRALRAHF